jgi:hypothetical protein
LVFCFCFCCFLYSLWVVVLVLVVGCYFNQCTESTTSRQRR